MAKVVLDDDNVAIRVSWVERLMLAEKSRKVPLESIRSVDPHPPLVDMMVHWADQSAVWLGGVSAYDGHLIPSTRNPNHTLAIEGEGGERIFVEVDDEAPDQLAARIQSAVRRKSGLPPPPEPDAELEDARPSQARIMLAKMVEEARAKDLEGDDEEDEDVRLRDPLMQGSLPPPPRMPRIHKTEPPAAQATKPARLKSDRDLARLGGWLVAVGSLGVLTGTTIVAAGLVPGLLAVGAGIACGVLGGVALAVVSNHQD